MARGLGPNVGSFDASIIKSITDCDPTQSPTTILTGSADAINPHSGGFYTIATAGVDAITLPAPTAGADDGVVLWFVVDSANAHTLTCPSAILCNGAAANTSCVFKAFKGSNLELRAYNGIWQVLGSNVTSFT